MDDTLNRILSVEPDSWIEGLPAYQKNLIQSLYEKNSDYNIVAEKWLTAAPSNTAFFGTEPNKKIFFEKLIDELELFLRHDEKYKNEYAEFLTNKSVVQTMITSGVAVALAPYLGVAATFIAPVVAIYL